jgi:hypothetical protein
MGFKNEKWGIFNEIVFSLVNFYFSGLEKPGSENASGFSRELRSEFTLLDVLF